MKKVLTYTSVIFLFALFASSSAQAVGLSVAPSELRIKAFTGDTSTVKLTVKNSSDKVSLFDVYPDDFDSAIKIMPSSFVIEGGESREIGVQVNLKEEGEYRTDISVVAKPLSDNSFRAGAGVKIPLYMGISKVGDNRLALIYYYFGESGGKAFGMVVFLIFWIASFFVFQYAWKRIRRQ
jgi:hypothetical protein